jgi:hypothetical protein
VFYGAAVSFDGAQFSGGTVNFRIAGFSGGTVSFDGAQFSGSEVDFSEADDWSHPPRFDWTGVPPTGVKLPGSADSKSP